MLTISQVPSPVQSPLGGIIAAECDGALCALIFGDDRTWLTRFLDRMFASHESRDGAPTAALKAAMEAYFDGVWDGIAALPLAMAGTPFEKRVWDALRAIPPGETRSYGDLALAIGQPGSARAVGRANACNPVSLVVPCHRVIGANGTLTGYGGGLERKRWLLVHEGALMV